MNPVIISTEALRKAPRAFGQTGSYDANNSNHFSDLPLPARLLLAVARARGYANSAPLPERYVLDTLGRIIDAGPERRRTIEAVNLLAEILLNPEAVEHFNQPGNPEYLSKIENLVLCMLCKIHGGQPEAAVKLAHHTLAAPAIEPFNQAAAALCNADCFKRGGCHVFTPSWRGMPDHNAPLEHRSVSSTNELSLGESVLLNALRLRKRTLSYSGLGSKVVPLLCYYVALPELQSVIDAHLVEALRYSPQIPKIQCLCCPDISADEALLLGSMAEFCTGDAVRIEKQLSTWLAEDSIKRLQKSSQHFQDTLRQIGTPLPSRQWDLRELRAREELHTDCRHVNEPAMIH